VRVISDPAHDRTHVGWAPRLDAERRVRAIEGARLIASRVTVPAAVADSVRLAQQQTQFPRSIHWNPTALAQGDAGQVLLASQLDRTFPRQDWDLVAHDHLARAIQAHRRVPVRQPGLISGLAGLAYATRQISNNHRYQHLLTELQGAIAHGSLAEAARIRGRDGVTVSSFDLISGLSGVLLGLLPTKQQPASSPALPFLVRALCELVLAEGELPAWHTPAGMLFDDDQRAQYPDGNLNFGLAHGAPGILAGLSIAALTGQRAERLEPAIRRLAEWLIDYSRGGSASPSWPTVVPLRQHGGRLVPIPDCGESRDAWCYGTPGVARALYLAGAAIREPGWQGIAMSAMAGVFARPVAERGIDSPTFCHGVAGLLQITLRFAHDTGSPMFDRAASQLTDQILDAMDPTRPMAIANIEPGDNPVDQPGLLDGATGVCLALLSAGTDVEPTWDRIFGLA
jgi:class I lanthipeptide synthase